MRRGVSFLGSGEWVHVSHPAQAPGALLCSAVDMLSLSTGLSPEEGQPAPSLSPEAVPPSCRCKKWAGTTWPAGWGVEAPCWGPRGEWLAAGPTGSRRPSVSSARGVGGCKGRPPRAVRCSKVQRMYFLPAWRSVQTPSVRIPLSHCRTLPKSYMEKIVENVRKYNIHALLVIGGFEVSPPQGTKPGRAPGSVFLCLGC